MQSIPVSNWRLTVSAMAGVTCAAMTAEPVISALASRAGMSSQPLGGGSRPTCEVLIRVLLRCMFLSSPVPACDPAHDNTMANRWNRLQLRPQGSCRLRVRCALPAVYESHQRRAVAWRAVSAGGPLIEADLSRR